MYELRASALGSCTKAQAAGLQDYKPLPTPDKIQGYYDKGNEHETANAAKLRDDGWLITGEQHEVTLSFPGVTVTGHLDGMIKPINAAGSPIVTRIWESKSPGAWAKFEKAYKTGDWSDPLCHRYAWQASVYMVAKDMEMMVTCLDDDKIRSFVVETPPFPSLAIQDRVAEIRHIADSGALPAECSQRDWPCPYAYLHEDEPVEEDEQLDMLVEYYDTVSDGIKELEAQKKEWQNKIRAHLGERTEVTTLASKVTVFTQAGPSKWDVERMEADGIDPTKYKTPGKPSSRVSITRRDGE